jgi:biotin transporter BioY
MTTSLIVATLGVKAFYLLYIWLISAWVASWLSDRKGYGEKWGLGTGLLLSAIGVVIWLVVPAKSTSIVSQRKARQEHEEQEHAQEG